MRRWIKRLWIMVVLFFMLPIVFVGIWIVNSLNEVPGRRSDDRI